jgi:hypothetical protein
VLDPKKPKLSSTIISMPNVSHEKDNLTPNSMPNKFLWQGQPLHYTTAIHNVLYLGELFFFFALNYFLYFQIILMY